FLTTGLRSLAVGDPWLVDPLGVVSPTYVPDLVNAVLDLLIDRESGIWHVANPGAVSWFDFARAAARAAGFDPADVQTQVHASGRRTARPPYGVLGSERGWPLPPLETALQRFLEAAPSFNPMVLASSSAADCGAAARLEHDSMIVSRSPVGSALYPCLSEFA